MRPWVGLPFVLVSREGPSRSRVSNTAALDRLKKAIEGSGIGPNHFVWPPSEDRRRAPYRGWDPFEDIDAGVFFGRDAAIVRGMDELRAMRLSGVNALFVVLGPSGSGKSSFLRAGLIPRLQRDDRHFLTLGIMRPEANALSGDHGFAAAIAGACQALKLRDVSLGDIKNTYLQDGERLYQLLMRLRGGPLALWRRLWSRGCAQRPGGVADGRSGGAGGPASLQRS